MFRRIDFGVRFLAISTFAVATCLAQTTGAVWDWGLNSAGQLGNGGNDDSNVPKQVSSLSGVIAIAASYGHGLALTSDGKVWTWGYNAQGRPIEARTRQAMRPNALRR